MRRLPMRVPLSSEAQRETPGANRSLIMPASSFSLPAEFSFLSRASRPSRKEVDTYAELIAATEGGALESPEARRHEAELQLWLWRAENRPRNVRAPRRTQATR
jgi:hypothetical protein